MILLDTNVLSALRNQRIIQRQGKSFTNWARNTNLSASYVSAISIAELETGVARKELSDPEAGRHLRSWLDNELLPKYDGRVLAVDTKVALVVGRMHVPNQRSYRDAFIAATALVHSMTVITRNVSDFTMPGLAVFNPW